MGRPLNFDRRRYWLLNGWSIRFRIAEIDASRRGGTGSGIPSRCMIMTLADCWALTTRMGCRALRPMITGTASGAPGQLVVYEFRGADELICDFFASVEQACK